MHCQYCGQKIFFTDDRIEDLISKEYPGKAMCERCFNARDLGQILQKQDFAEDKKPGTNLKEMAKMYGLKIKE